MAVELSNPAIPLGELTFGPLPTNPIADYAKWSLFQIATQKGWCIFYELPSPANSAPGSYGVIFFANPAHPGRVLFKVFIDRPCPPVLTISGYPLGPMFSSRRRPNTASSSGGNSSGGTSWTGSGNLQSTGLAHNAGFYGLENHGQLSGVAGQSQTEPGLNRGLNSN
ncbi:hypothetical protein FRC11_006701 [Ceratobasidium sp. 423]|nr:hypothetical protein FRC11_006701 [Ceratobasidium sp. 423]